MKALIREPLVHFLLIGAALFLVFAVVHDGEDVQPDSRIVVSSGRIEQLSNLFAKTWQRPPTREELQGAIDDFVLEEIYYRSAMELGLDRDDTIIRRRLRQKLEFMTDDTAALISPSDQELQEYLSDHVDRFRRAGTYTFKQVYFNPERHGEDPEMAVAAQLEGLRQGSRDVGDSSLLPSEFEESPRPIIDGTFGAGFCDRLDKLPIGQWEGPVRSGLGLHLVHVSKRTRGEVPELEEIRTDVQREWANAKRLALRSEVNTSMRAGYDVVIEWPESEMADSPAEAP